MSTSKRPSPPRLGENEDNPLGKELYNANELPVATEQPVFNEEIASQILPNNANNNNNNNNENNLGLTEEELVKLQEQKELDEYVSNYKIPSTGINFTAPLPLSINPKPKLGKLYIGTAAFSTSEWRDGVWFPREVKKSDEHSFYASRFNTVEINTTFYGGKKWDVYKNWAKKVSKYSDWVYSIKMFKSLTHDSGFKSPKSDWERLYSGVLNLGRHLGPILIQLPPSLTKSSGLVSLIELTKIVPKDVKIAFDFRHSSWWSDFSIDEILHSRNWSRVQTQSKDLTEVIRFPSNWHYIRMHGPQELHASSYSDQDLTNWSQKIHTYRRSGRDIYVYFNNDAFGYGPKNATKLKSMCRSLAGESTPSSEKKVMGMSSLASMFAKQTQKNNNKRKSSNDKQNDEEPSIKKIKL